MSVYIWTHLVGAGPTSCLVLALPRLSFSFSPVLLAWPPMCCTYPKRYRDGSRNWVPGAGGQVILVRDGRGTGRFPMGARVRSQTLATASPHHSASRRTTANNHRAPGSFQHPGPWTNKITNSSQPTHSCRATKSRTLILPILPITINHATIGQDLAIMSNSKCLSENFQLIMWAFQGSSHQLSYTLA
ncbi:hypothetical protein PAXRUDRAFT_449445 [Paxillus rubicundulus Ve08.2h10]|uniref:Uncharacterized protein n=1 Tax=Paxillus rubicundulus Ve08.2h10 TaxID=930991 RepID=A0A0D0E7Z5_9AGAM|nr:hypothetical protein PAXRUDRAFT_449445 [Paxillus rubicundulus Ve08.2h10]